MPQATKRQSIARAYVSDAVAIPVEEQIRQCTAAVAALGLPTLDKVYGPAEADRFILDLRPTEVAVVFRLLALDERPPPSGMGVGAALMERIVAIEGRCRYVYDVVAELRSTDRRWVEHRRKAVSTVSRGRTLKQRKARAMQRAAAESRGSVVENWKAMEGTAIYKRVGQHWRDPNIANAQEAIDTAPEEAGGLRGMSVSSWTEVFGGRTGKKRAMKKVAKKARGKKR